MKVCGGSVAVRGKVAYAGQRPFIQNATLRDNILFGLEFSQEKYDRTLQVSEVCVSVCVCVRERESI